MTIPRYLLAALPFALLAADAKAHDAKEMAEHPATKVVFSYLSRSMAQEWGKAVELIDERSLTGLQSTYVSRIKAAGTVGEEAELCARLGLDVKGIAGLDPAKFYTRYMTGKNVDDEQRDEILKSLQVKLISHGVENVEGKDFCHVVLRTRYQSGGERISAVEMISLIKNDSGAWRISLRAAQPSVAPVFGE